MELKEIIELKTTQAQEESIFYSKVLEELMDEGSTLQISNKAPFITPIDKINHVIEALEALKEDIETIDLLVELENEVI